MHSRHYSWVSRATIGFSRFSGARASLNYVLAFLAVLAPLGILTMQPSGRAIGNRIIVNTLTDVSTIASGLLGYWHFDGNDVDSSGNGYNVTLVGSAGFGPGLFGQALSLPGNISSYADRPGDDPVFDFGSNDFTIQVWFNFNAVNGEQTLFEKFEGSNGPGWTLTTPGGNDLQFYSNVIELDAGETFTSGQWHQAIVRRSGSTFDMFYDGNKAASGQGSGAITTSTNPLLFGKRNPDDGRGFPVNGSLDEVAVWNRALSDAEVSELWNGGAGMTLSNIITVSTLSDSSTSGDGLCSLREAINNANTESDTTSGDCAAGTGTDTIVFNVSGTITLSGTLTIENNISATPSLTVDGSGQTISIDGANSYRIFFVSTGSTLTLNNLAIQHGSVGGANFGGGIDNFGTVTVVNSTFSQNQAFLEGGGVFNNPGAIATITDSAFSANSAQDGGGIFGYGTMTITNSTFSGNSGGAVFGYGTTTVANTTFSGNTGSISGIYNSNSGTMTVTNSTLSGNSGVQGSGIYNSGGTLTVTNSTFSGNSASVNGGGIFSSGTATLTNTSLSSNSGGNCYTLNGGTIDNGGYNISDDGSCGFGTSTGANGKTIGDNVNPQLDPSGLQNNGGPTATIALDPFSPAIAAIPSANCPATDQRGDPRPAPGQTACDIGAYEGSEQLVVSPSKLNFGTVSVGATSALQTVTIASEFGDDNVDFFATFITSNFIVTGNNCPATLGPLQSCQVSFACKPKTTGSLIGAYAFLYGSWESMALDPDDFRRIGVVQFTCTGASGPGPLQRRRRTR